MPDVQKIEALQKMVDSFFIKVVCKEDYYIHAAVYPGSGPGPEPTLAFEKGKMYQYKLDLYDHPYPEFRCVWHTVYEIPEPGEEMYPHGMNFSLENFKKYFDCIEE